MLSPKQMKRRLLEQNYQAAADLSKRIQSRLMKAMNSPLREVRVLVKQNEFGNPWVKQLIIEELDKAGWSYSFSGEGTLEITYPDSEEPEETENKPNSIESVRTQLARKYSSSREL